METEMTKQKTFIFCLVVSKLVFRNFQKIIENEEKAKL